MSFIRPLLSVTPQGIVIPTAGPPTVTSISPNNGDFAGGTAVTITGTNFRSGATVKIGGHSCTSVVMISSTTLTAVTGAASPSDVGVAENVVVTTTKGAGTGVGLYTYTGWMSAFQIGGVNPNLFADLTTEGTSNHYLLNNVTYGSFSAWLTALSGTFTRSTTAYFTNSSGNLASASSGVIRFDYDPIALTSKGLLLEGSSTNKQIHSQDTTGWNNLSGYTLTNNSTAAPDGTTTAIKLAENSNASATYQTFPSAVITTGSANVTISGYFKSIGRRYLILENGATATQWYLAVFDLQNGVVTQQSAGSGGTNVSASIVNQGNGWYRCIVTGSFAGASTFFNPMSSDSATPSIPANGQYAVTGLNADAYYMWGAQVEDSQSFASSYIPTTSATVTRAADSLTATPISSWYNATNGVLFAASDTNNPGVTNANIVEITDVGGNNGAGLINETAAANNFLAQVYNGGIAQFTPRNVDTGQSPYVVNVLGRAAISTQASNFHYVRDGGVDDSSASGSMPTSPTQIGIGGGTLTAAKHNGHISQIGYWPTTATSGQLQTLTSPAAWVPTAVGVLPSIFADFAGGNYMVNGYVMPSLAAWESEIGATFSRASTAYFTNSSGNLQQALSGVLRFDFDPVSIGTAKGILLEGASTNIILQSDTFSNASWTKSAGITGVAQNVTGPDGVGNSAWTVTCAAGASGKQVYQQSATNTTQLTNSVYAKAGTVNWFALAFDADGVTDGAFFNLQTGVIGTVAAGTTATITNVGNGWYRCTATRTYSSAGHFTTNEPHTADNQATTWTAAGTETVLIFGAQQEALPFASSYIPTTSSTATRAADSFSGSAALVNAPAGTLFAKVNEAGVTTTNTFPFSFSDGSNNNRSALEADGNNGFGFSGAVGGVTQFNIQSFVNPVAGSTFKQGGAYSSGANTSAVYVNGVSRGASTCGSALTGQTQLVVGALTAGGSGQVYADIFQIGYWSAAATNSQLQTLTT